MDTLKGFQKMYLRGRAHALRPVVAVGHAGLTPAVVAALDLALFQHELVKVRFLDFKEKDRKKELIDAMQKGAGSMLAGAIGHVAVLYRMQPDPAKRKINLPLEREAVPAATREAAQRKSR